MRRIPLYAAASAALVLSTLTGAQPALAGGSDLAWEPCGEQQGECTSVEVPLDWQDPDGTKIEIAIGRLPATEPENRIGVLFAAPGGPGASGIDMYVNSPDALSVGELRKRFDIVSWDQRGVVRSSEVRCSAELLKQKPSSFPESEQEYQDLLDYNAKLGEDCEQNSPAFGLVDTVSAVRDLDAIRAALGEEQLNFYGASYGTQVGQQYAELFPDRVRAMVLDSNMDHSMSSGGDYIATTTEDQEGAFNAFADWCERTQNCALHGSDVRALWADLHGKAEAGTLTDPVTGKPLSAEFLRRELKAAMYAPEERWFPLAERFQALAGGGPAIAAQAAPVELAQNSYQAIWCDDWRWDVGNFAELQSYRDRAEQLAPQTKLSPFWSDVATCLNWPGEVSNPQHRPEIAGTPPILLVTARYDVATPNAWNRTVADQIENSVLLHYDGVGHGQYYHSPCVTDYVDDYVTTLRTPAPDTHCEAVWPTQPAG
ncbi:alpha/beta hydrolase [Saccharopolyspora indica]|uniref:alpha/beta hydrolase n=1 Tax=Saccharopolyspora indica TaxID=1229659 RepID=UPI0022EA88B4|nr:alpha/beta hydrolase [Saccharopolyspora indica]MDA3647765.1 alpha/beta hydrolase [Saccharopolyspora indica]